MKEMYLTLFPDLARISNQALCEAACGIWDLMLHQSKWPNLESVPFTLKGEGGSLVAHTRATMCSALRIAQDMHAVYPDKSPDTDVVLLAAFLHDVSKILEYAPEGRTREGELYQHAFLAAHAALNAGMPEAVVSIIMLHTPQSNVPMQFIEGVIVKHAEAGVAASGADYQRLAQEALA